MYFKTVIGQGTYLKLDCQNVAKFDAHACVCKTATNVVGT